MRPPVVLISAGFTDYGDYLGVAYSRPLEAVGAVPLMLPFLEDPAPALELADAVLLGFGRDLDPSRYGAGRHPSLTAISPLRDELDLRLAAAALDRGLPVLGICRGMQVLNVLRGGTLYRDRSEYPEAAVAHPGGDWALWDEVCDATLGRRAMPEHPGHPLRIARGSRLAAALGAERGWANSYHHQAIDRLGAGVVPVAWADDGIVEAIELDGDAWVLGVQWELQESWKDDRRMLRVFEHFVSARARRRARSAAA
jgi:putative glutamine amidotransferase